jgi:hypothetical protein
VAEVADSGRIHERRGHEQREQGYDRIEILDDEWRVAQGIGKRSTHLNLVCTGRAKDQQRNDEEENPNHPGAEPKTNLKQGYAKKH